jgi:hypothetical protein
MRAKQEEETSILALRRAALLLPPHPLMAGSAAQVGKDVVVLSVPRTAPAARRASGWRQVRPAWRQATAADRLPFAIGTSSTRTVITSTPARSTLAGRRTHTRRSWMRFRRSVMSRACPYCTITYYRCAKANGKTDRGDHVIKDANIDGNHNVIVDVTCIHEFCGNHLVDVSRNGQLRDPDVNKLLQNAARTKAARYRDGYANRPGTTDAFLPGVMSTSCRIHGVPAPPLHPCPPANSTIRCQLGGCRARHRRRHLAPVSIPLPT